MSLLSFKYTISRLFGNFLSKGRSKHQRSFALLKDGKVLEEKVSWSFLRDVENFVKAAHVAVLLSLTWTSCVLAGKAVEALKMPELVQHQVVVKSYVMLYFVQF